MFQQPFCMYENLLFFCDGGPLVLGCDFSRDGKYVPARLSLPCDPPSNYVGVAFSKDSKEVLAIDSFNPRLLLNTIGCHGGQQEIRIANSNLSPRSATYAYGKFWLTLLEGDFETKLAYIDIEKKDLQILEIESKWGQGEINLVGYPLVMNCHDQLVLYNPFMNILYWLEEDCSVIRYIELHPESVLGQTGSGDLLVLEKLQKNYSLSQIDSQGKILMINSDFRIPCESVIGITMTSNEMVIVLGENGDSLYYSQDTNTWKNLPISAPTLLWEAYMEQGEV